VARRGQQEQYDERKESKRLKWHAGDRTVERTAFEDAQDGIGVTACVIGDDDQDRVDQSKREHRYPDVAAVVEQRQEFWVQAAQRPDAEDDVQQEKRRRSKRAHEHDFVGDVRE